MFMAILLQAAAPATAGPSQNDRPPRRSPTRCPLGTEDDGDIVVCGRSEPQEQFRMRPLTHQYDPVGGPGIGFRLGGGTGNVYAASGQSQDGKPDKRLMVTLKFPF